MADLISVEEALERVIAATPTPVAEERELRAAAGCVLAQEVRADGDYPAFPRSRVDGYAVRAADVAATPADLRVVCEVPAGKPPGDRVEPGEAARVFTGAPVPDGADAVVMQEQCETPADATVRVGRSVESGQNVTPRAVECASGDVVAVPGDLLTPARVGALGCVGAARVLVCRTPTVRVVSTGSELVPIDSTPPPGSIRNSNGVALAAAAEHFGGRVDAMLCAEDDPGALDDAVAEALEADVVLLTGGVSVGDYDLVPQTLATRGVECLFHGVRLQPGKPLWFGRRGRTLVFGLPGNPVSALVNCHLFVRQALALLRGLPAPGLPTVRAELTGPLGRGTWRRKYLPVELEREGDGWRATPLVYAGSGDVFAFSRATGLAVVPEESGLLVAGDRPEVVPLG